MADYPPGTVLTNRKEGTVWVVDRDGWLRLARWGASLRLRHAPEGDSPLSSRESARALANVDLGPDRPQRLIGHLARQQHLTVLRGLEPAALALLDYVMGRDDVAV